MPRMVARYGADNSTHIRHSSAGAGGVTWGLGEGGPDPQAGGLGTDEAQTGEN